MASYLIKRPLAPPLSIDTSEIKTPTEGLVFPVPLPTSLSINVPTATSGPEITEIPAQTNYSEPLLPSSTPLPTEPALQRTRSGADPYELCDLHTAQSFLLIAVDKENANRIHPVNFIRLVNLNPSEKNITVFALSQTTQVSGQMLDRLNIEESQLGDVFDYVINNASGDPKDIQYVASNYLAQSLFDAFGFVPNHFVTFDLSTALFTILKTDKIRPAASGELMGAAEIKIFLGQNQGEAENFSARQDLVLISLIKYLQNNDSETIANAFIKLSGDSVITDLDSSQFSQYFCILDNIDEEMISFSTLSK